jgi:hypothetical protein
MAYHTGGGAIRGYGTTIKYSLFTRVRHTILKIVWGLLCMESGHVDQSTTVLRLFSNAKRPRRATSGGVAPVDFSAQSSQKAFQSSN